MSELNHANAEISGFGSHSAQEVEKLQKALGLGGQGGNAIDIGLGDTAPFGANAGYANQTPSSFRQGDALAVEDLDRTLKLVTFGLEHLRLWKDILKERVPQVVHEYNVQNAYGESDASPFFEMGATPAETDAQYARDVVQIKYLGTRGAVLHNLTLIQAAHGPVVAREVKNKTIELLSRNERAMFDANSKIQGLEYDGLELQIISKAASSIYQSTAFEGYGNNVSATSAPHILDANNADLDEDICEDAGLTAVNNFGMPMDLYLGTDVHSAFSRAFYAKQRTVPGDSLTSGNRVKEHMGTLDFRFKPSLFNRPKKINVPALSHASDTAAAAAVIAGTAGTDDVNVKYAPVFADGEGVLSVGVDATSAAETAQITAIANVLYYNLYLKPSTGASANREDYIFFKRVAAGIAESLVNEVFDISGAPANVNSGPITLRRDAGAADAYLLMHDPDVLCWKQLGSMIKYDLAVTTTQYEWLQLLYGTPLVMAPLKNVIIRNLASN